MSKYQNIVIEVKDKVGIITLDRKDHNNSLDSSISKEIFEAMNELQNLNKVHVILLFGNKKFFSPGADINELKAHDKSSAEDKQLFSYFDKILEIKIPIIACVEGYALGGGMELALICDFIIASENAKFAQPEINLGLIPGIGGTQRLKKYIGKYNANFLCLTGEMISSKRAYELGFVSILLDEANFHSESLMLANKLSNKPKSSLIEIKKLISKDLNLDSDLNNERKAFFNLLDSENKKIGIESFLNKAKPNWKN